MPIHSPGTQEEGGAGTAASKSEYIDFSFE